MGGGDLNMKKHFHPLTMENLERVWKAEEKKRVEEERITQLQEELKEERQKEIFEQQAVQTGLKKKKKEKLDWMYEGQQAVDTEAYLLGKKIDKHVAVAKEEQPGLSSGTVTVKKTSLPKTKDVLAKIKEDPLFLIKKKEEDNRKTLMSNPIKLRKMKELIREQASLAGKHDRKHKKSKKKKRPDTSPSSSSEGSSEEDTDVRRRRERHSRSPSPQLSHKSNNRRNEREHIHKQYTNERNHNTHQNDDEYERRERRGNDDEYERKERRGDSSHKGCHNDDPHDRKESRGGSGKERLAYNSRDGDGNDGGRKQQQKRYYNDRTRRQRSSTSSDEEDGLAAQRDAMMNNAKWRQEQRSQNTKKYKIEKEAEEKHVETMLKKSSSTEEKAYFVQKMQKDTFNAKGVSVQDRIHRNIHSKQRTSAAIDKKFTSK